MLFYTIVERFVTVTYLINYNPVIDEYAYLFIILFYWNSVAVFFYCNHLPPLLFQPLNIEPHPQRWHHARYPLCNLYPRLQF